MSIVQDMSVSSAAAMYARSLQQLHPQSDLQRLDKQWVESSSNQYPLRIESHLRALIKKLGLCTSKHQRISRKTIDHIISASCIYFEQTGWENEHYERLREKLNLKVWHLRAQMMGQACWQRMPQTSIQGLPLNTMERATQASNPSSMAQISRGAQLRPAPSQPATQQNPVPASKDIQHSLSNKDLVMAMWDSMSMKDQMDLFLEQLRTAKDFRGLELAMGKCWTDRCKRGSADIPPTFTIPPKQTTVCLDTNITTSSTQGLPSGTKSRVQPQILFDGLPSPTQTPERTLSMDLLPTYPLEPLSPIEDAGDENWARSVSEETLGTPEPPSKSLVLDVKSIFNERLRELQAGKQAKDAAREKEERGQELEELRRKKELEDLAQQVTEEEEELHSELHSLVEDNATYEGGQRQEYLKGEGDELETRDERSMRRHTHCGLEKKLEGSTPDKEKFRKGSPRPQLKRKLDNDTSGNENKRRSRIQVVIPIL